APHASESGGNTSRVYLPPGRWRALPLSIRFARRSHHRLLEPCRVVLEPEDVWVVGLRTRWPGGGPPGGGAPDAERRASAGIDPVPRFHVAVNKGHTGAAAMLCPRIIPIEFSGICVVGIPLHVGVEGGRGSIPVLALVHEQPGDIGADRTQVAAFLKEAPQSVAV